MCPVPPPERGTATQADLIKTSRGIYVVPNAHSNSDPVYTCGRMRGRSRQPHETVTPGGPRVCREQGFMLQPRAAFSSRVTLLKAQSTPEGAPAGVWNARISGLPLAPSSPIPQPALFLSTDICQLHSGHGSKESHRPPGGLLRSKPKCVVPLWPFRFPSPPKKNCSVTSAGVEGVRIIGLLMCLPHSVPELALWILLCGFGKPP